MPRLPPALEVFPTLVRFQTMRPRRLAEVPVGGPAGNVTAKALQQSAIHLYHDLGVLVFAGCSVGEVRRIGDVLRAVVAWGGQGGVVARLDAWEGEVVRRREGHVWRDGELYRDLDEKRVSLTVAYGLGEECKADDDDDDDEGRLALCGRRRCCRLRRDGSKRRSGSAYRSCGMHRATLTFGRRRSFSRGHLRRGESSTYVFTTCLLPSS